MNRATGRSLLVRLPLLAMAVLAVSFVAATALVFEILLVNGRRDLEAALRREEARVHTAIDQVLTRDSRPAEPDDVTAAATTYFERNPGTNAYLTIVRVGSELVRADSGPAQIDRLLATATLPAASIEGLTTVSTSEGDILSLAGPITIDGRFVASAQIVAPLAPIRDDALRSLRVLGLASGLSILVGGGILALTLRRTLRPLRSLATTAQSTELTHLSDRVAEPTRLDEVGVLAREFNRMLGRLEQADEAREQFLATVSHELRTPITIARGHTEVLTTLASASPERVDAAANVILEELARLSRLVDDLMALARSDTEAFVIPSALSLTRFFDDLRIRLTGLGLTTVRVHDPPDETTEADADRLAQAVLNLVVNAATHNPAGTGIDIEAVATDHAVEIVVSDDGPGVDPTILDRAFEPYVKTTGSGTPSSGLGLAVAAAIMAAHAGQATMKSSPSGTTVTLRLPRPHGEPGVANAD